MSFFWFVGGGVYEKAIALLIAFDVGFKKSALPSLALSGEQSWAE
jgi:hypothetical protein